MELTSQRDAQKTHDEVEYQKYWSIGFDTEQSTDWSKDLEGSRLSENSKLGLQSGIRAGRETRERHQRYGHML